MKEEYNNNKKGNNDRAVERANREKNAKHKKIRREECFFPLYVTTQFEIFAYLRNVVVWKSLILLKVVPCCQQSL